MKPPDVVRVFLDVVLCILTSCIALIAIACTVVLWKVALSL